MQFGLNTWCHRLWKSCPKCNKSPNIVTLAVRKKAWAFWRTWSNFQCPKSISLERNRRKSNLPFEWTIPDLFLLIFWSFQTSRQFWQHLNVKNGWYVGIEPEPEQQQQQRLVCHLTAVRRNRSHRVPDALVGRQPGRLWRIFRLRAPIFVLQRLPQLQPE